MPSLTPYLLLLLLLAGGACQKETAEPADAYPFVAGELIVGIKANVPINQVFQLANAQQFPLSEMGGFYYTSALPQDSLAYVLRVLKAKPYLNQRGFTSHAYSSAVDGALWEDSFLFDMDATSQQDWLATIPQLRLTDARTNRYVRLRVPVGQEKFWRTALRQNELVEWTQLSTSSTAVPFH